MRKFVLLGSHEFSDVSLPDGTPAEEITPQEKKAWMDEYKDTKTLLDMILKRGDIPVRVAGKIRWCQVREIK
jgi:hypothetical protein